METDSLLYCLTREEPLRKPRQKGYRQSSESRKAAASHAAMDDGRTNRHSGKVALDTVAIVLAVLGIALWLPSFQPNLLIGARSVYVDANYAFETPFSITNNGLYSIGPVIPVCYIKYLDTWTSPPGPKGTHSSFSSIPLFDGTKLFADLSRSNAFDFVCPFNKMFNTGGPLRSADIEVFVFYKLPWTMIKHLPFLNRIFIKCAEFTTVKSHDLAKMIWLQNSCPSEDLPKYPPHLITQLLAHS